MSSSQILYRCPGEDHFIERSVHLGRLAALYPDCQGCEHRGDHAPLTTVQIGRLNDIQQRKSAADLFAAEGLAGVGLNEIDYAAVRRFAAALGSALARNDLPAGAAQPPNILVAGDGRSLTAELVAAAIEGVRMTGCQVIEMESATAPRVGRSVGLLNAGGGLHVGNFGGESRHVGISVFGPAGRPWSSGQSLDLLQDAFLQPMQRPVRHFGAFQRAQATSDYLASLAEIFHALRPLRFVLDTTSLPLLTSLQQLLVHGGCEVIPRRQPRSSAGALDGGRRLQQNHPIKVLPYLDQRLKDLAAQVTQQGAHFGLWVDGNGEQCRLVDEQGRRVPGESWLQTTALFMLAERGAGVVLETGTSERVAKRISAAGGQIEHGPAARESMFAAIARSGATLGGGKSGRFWFGGQTPTADALLAIGLLLALLSKSDRPLSEVLDAA